MRYFMMPLRERMRGLILDDFWSDLVERLVQGMGQFSLGDFPGSMRFSVSRPQCYYVLDRPRIATLLSSSMAEHPAVNRRVVGSSPT
jgi:hypothetical protein